MFFPPTLLLVCLATLALAQELILVRNTTADSLALEYMTLFLGEFPCINPNISGSRRILRFASELANIGDQIARRNVPPQLEYQIENLSNVTLLSGTIDLPCLRDTACQGGGDFTYYTCVPAAVSPGCETITARHTICHWIDITPLPQSTYTLYLAVENSTVQMTFDIPTLPRISRGGTARIASAMSANIVIILLVVFVPWCIWRERKPNQRSPAKQE